MKIIIHRTRIGTDIVAEFAVPTSAKARKAGKVAILASGAPTMPGRSSLMEFLVRKGYYVINPRYRGTWESAGTFLGGDPTDDIREVIDAVMGGVFRSLYENVDYAFPKKPVIHLFVSSFGGPAGFFLSSDARVSKVIAISPVCDWTAPSKTEPLATMNEFTKRVYGEGYRFSKKGWVKLASGTFYNPVAALDRINGSAVLIFHARNDDVVPFTSVFDFAYATGATLKASRTGGHMGLSEAINEETWQEIKRFVR